MNWSDERPTEPGEYWVSIHPNKRGRGASKTAWPYQTTIEKGTGEPVLTVPSEAGGWFFVSLYSSILDGAKWARREVPADPFQSKT